MQRDTSSQQHLRSKCGALKSLLARGDVRSRHMYSAPTEFGPELKTEAMAADNDSSTRLDQGGMLKYMPIV